MALLRYGIAEKAFQCAINLDPKHSLPWSHLGEVLREQHKLEESLDAYRKAVKLDGTNSISWSGLGQVLNRLGRYDEAIEPHKRAIELGNDNFANQFGLGIAYLGTEQWMNAAKALLKSLHDNPSSPAKLYMNRVREQLLELGEESLVREIDADPNNRRGMVAKAIRLAKTGHIKEAQELCDKLIQLDTKDSSTLAGLCSAYRKIKQLDRAIDAGKAAVETDPGNNSAWYALGRAYEDAEHFDAAERAFQETLRLNPTHKKAINALQRVQERLTRNP
jgi:tetratricopeptide (TPR) repeat protein